jgi:nucleolar complex protein 2
MLPNSKSSAWKKISFSLKTYTKSLIHLLENLKDDETLTYVMNYVYDAVPYFGHFEKESRKLLRVLINNLGHKKEVIRIRSFLCIHRMGIMFPYPFLDLCIKGVYFTLVQNAKSYNHSNFEMIDFLINSFVELCGIDAIVAYQHGFIYIRQLAITLRKSLANEKDAWAIAFNWKFINCLRCWTKVLSTYPRDDLRELIYPLVQIILGTLTVNANPRFFPIRFKCVSMLNEISKKTGFFIPVGGTLMDVLNRDEAFDLPKSISKNPLDFHFHLKLKEGDRKTSQFQVKIIEETSYLLLEYLSIHSHSIAFPEVAFPVWKYLKRFLKSHKVRSSTLAKFLELIKKIEENSKFIYEKRSVVEFTPLDYEKVENFLSSNASTPLKDLYVAEEKKKYQELLDQIAARRLHPNTSKDSDDEEEEEVGKKKDKKRKNNEEFGPKKKPKQDLDDDEEKGLVPVLGQNDSSEEEDFKQEDYVVKQKKKKFQDIVEPLDLADF